MMIKIILAHISTTVLGGEGAFTIAGPFGLPPNLSTGNIISIKLCWNYFLNPLIINYIYFCILPFSASDV